MRVIRTFDEFRAAAKDALATGRAPEEVTLHDAQSGQLGLGLDAEEPEGPSASAEQRSIEVSRSYFDLAKTVACHREPERWNLLYRILWRIVHGERHLMKVSSDDDIFRATRLAKAVRRDTHKMKAFVRFRRVERPIDPGTDHSAEEWYIAWHQPDHRILERVAPFFLERFGAMRWSIMTPDASVTWDLQELRFGPGSPRSQAPRSDELESLWLAYYASIFNPARIKLAAMRAEMPVKHWSTMPETALIPELLRQAPARLAAMSRSHETDYPPARTFMPPNGDLELLRSALPSCQACPLFEQATQAVFGEGPAGARLLLLGEQPGDLEDRTGRPFVGPAGELLDRALSATGLNRDELYLTNAVKHFKFVRKGKKRIHERPNASEIRACKDWVIHEIEHVRPETIVLLGATAGQALVGPSFRLNEHRGQTLSVHHLPPLVATHHPAAILRTQNLALRDRRFQELCTDLRSAADR